MLHKNDSAKTGAVISQISDAADTAVVQEVTVKWLPGGVQVYPDPVTVSGPGGKVRWTLVGAPAGATLDVVFSAQVKAALASTSKAAGQFVAAVKEERPPVKGGYKVTVTVPGMNALTGAGQKLLAVDTLQDGGASSGSGTGGDGSVDVSGWPPPNQQRDQRRRLRNP